MKIGKSRGTIISNEPIRKILDGWTFNENQNIFYMDFPNNLEYSIPITDFSGNISNILVLIQNATNIVLHYGGYNNSFVRAKSGEIAGKLAVSESSIYPFESLFIATTGQIDKNLLETKGYLYTYWGVGAKGVCKYAESTYFHGYSDWLTVNIDKLSGYYENYSTQLGGVGVNTANSACLNSNNRIPPEIAIQYLYGLSSISFRLKDYSSFSIAYQIYIKNSGWLPASSNGEEASLSLDKPFYALRINLVPKSQTQYLLDYWNKSK